jgi:hypothetical protein
MPAASDMQQMEIDMVAGLYADTFTVIGEDPPCYAVTLSATPEDPQELLVRVTYVTDEYPEAGPPPRFEVESISSSRRIAVGPLLKDLEEAMAELPGIHCVVAMLQRCQEYVTQTKEDLERQQLQRKGEALAAASTVNTVDPTVRMGNIVTRELFEEWQGKHLAAKAALRAEQNKLRRETASKLSGRQLWDTTLRQADWELFGAEGGDAVNLEDAGFEFEFGEEDGDAADETGTEKNYTFDEEADDDA